MQRYAKLAVWTEAHALVLRIYQATAGFPVSERYGITAQLRRAAVSIATNLAEGSRRATDREFAHFVSIAVGSAAEVEYLVFLSAELKLMDPGEAPRLNAALESICRRLCTLRQRLLTSHGQAVERSSRQAVRP